MKRLCLLFLAFLLVQSVFSQTEKGYVYLKNGTILKGRYQFDADSAKIQMYSAGNLWVFDANEVFKVTGMRNQWPEKPAMANSDRKYYFRTEVGVLAGSSDNSQSAPFSFTASLNYEVFSKFSAGAGVGLEFLKESYMPAFLALEYKFRDSWSSPYFFLKAGYQVPVEESRNLYTYDVQPWRSSIWPGPVTNENLDNKGGILVNPGIGFQRMYSPTFGMSVAFGYQFHRLKYTGENDYRLDIDYNRLTIKLGIIFN